MQKRIKITPVVSDKEVSPLLLKKIKKSKRKINFLNNVPTRKKDKCLLVFDDNISKYDIDIFDNYDSVLTALHQDKYSTEVLIEISKLAYQQYQKKLIERDELFPKLKEILLASA